MKLSSQHVAAALMLSFAAATPTPESATASNSQNVEAIATQAGPKWYGFDFDSIFEKFEQFFHFIPWGKNCDDYLNWRNYTANGVNLGGWLVQEKYIDNAWFEKLAPGAPDEWTLCQTLGSKCGPAMESRYASFITTNTIDKLALSDVNTIRIPTTYAAWIKVPGSQLYHGKQQVYLKKIAEYAISKYKMHVIIDLHSLPGGINSLDIGEKFGNLGWFQNETNLAYSYQVVGKVLDFIQASKYPTSYTLEPINEAMDNSTGFFSPNALTTEGAAWLLKYYNGVLDRIKKVNPKIPMMIMDSFAGETFWSPLYKASANIVIDTHIYFFATADAQSVPAAVCTQGAAAAGDHKFPVFIGEWSLQSLSNNTFAFRKTLFDTQRYAWAEYAHGGAFWTANFKGNTSVNGEGTQNDYWNYLGLTDAGVITKSTDAAYC